MKLRGSNEMARDVAYCRVGLNGRGPNDMIALLPEPMSDPTPTLDGTPSAGPRLESWKEIAAYLGRNLRTVQRWEKSEGLPVHRHRHASRGSIYAYAGELDRWREQRSSLPPDDFSELESPAAPPAESDGYVPTEVLSVPSGKRGKPRLVPWLSATLAVGMAVWTVSWLPGRLATARVPVAKPFLDYPGSMRWPSFSPDGKEIAFGWHPPGASAPDIYLKAIAGGTVRRLTADPAPDYYPRWSPDGRSLAFLRGKIGGALSVMLLSVADRRERKLSASLAPAWTGQGLEWSPDGKWLVVPDKDSAEDAAALFALSVETGSKHRLTRPPPDQIDFQPALSPDGTWLIFARTAGAGATNLVLQALDRDLTPKDDGVPLAGLAHAQNLFPAWSADGRDILFVCTLRSGANGICRLPAFAREGRAEEPELLMPVEAAVSDLTLHRGARGTMLAYSKDSLSLSVWRWSVTGQAPIPIHVASGNEDVTTPQFSPDGGRLVLVSNRSGTPEIWTADVDGSRMAQLTFFGGPRSASPCWSPDGRWILFDSAVGGWPQLFRMPASGGKVERLTQDRSNHIAPSWSRNGRWIYFGSDRGGRYQVWKMAADGSGAAIQVTREGGYAAIESADGERIFYTRGPEDDSPMATTPISGGEEKELLPSVNRGVFAVARDGIHFHPSPAAGESYSIRFLRFSDGRITEEVRSEAPFNYGLALSPDGGTLLYATVQQTGFRLMLVDGLR